MDANVSSRGNPVELADAKLTGGTRQITAAATYPAPGRQISIGAVQFKVVSNVHAPSTSSAPWNDRPGVKGTVQMSADGAARLAQKAGKAAVQIGHLRADVMARGLALDEQMLGDAHFTATTEGRRLNAPGLQLRRLHHRGDGRWRLAGRLSRQRENSVSQSRFRTPAGLALTLRNRGRQRRSSGLGSGRYHGRRSDPEAGAVERPTCDPAVPVTAGAGTACGPPIRAALTLRNEGPIL